MSFANCLIGPTNSAQWSGLLARFGEVAFRAAVDAEVQVNAPARIDRIRHRLGCTSEAPPKPFSSTELDPPTEARVVPMAWRYDQRRRA